MRISNSIIMLQALGLATANPVPPGNPLLQGADPGCQQSLESSGKGGISNYAKPQQPELTDSDEVQQPCRMPKKRASASVPECTKVVHQAVRLTHGPTYTAWTTTATKTQSIECEGCQFVEVSYQAFGVPPPIFFKTTITAKEASTTTVFACKASAEATPTPTPTAGSTTSSVHYYETPPVEVYTAMPPGVEEPQCTSQAYIEPVIPNSTLTVYKGTKTRTRTTECGSCALEWSTGIINFFAPIIITATMTAPRPSTSVVLACATPTS